MFKKYFTLLLSMVMLQQVFAQSQVVIDTKKKYKASITQNEKNKLVDIKKLIPNITLQLKYATNDNFTKTNLYTAASTTYLRKDAALALQNAAKDLQNLGFTFKIWDAYRPYAATKLMWELIKDERYVANPKSGSNHNRGLAIDLTLLDNNGKELDMGTGFDNFTDTAHHSFTNLSTAILANRKKLKEVMEQYGFKSLETEWWHYSFITTETYSIIDLSFKMLRKLIR